MPCIFTLILCALAVGKVYMGLSNGGLDYLSSTAYMCHHFEMKIPFTIGHKGAQLQQTVHELQRVAFSPHLRAPTWTLPILLRKSTTM